MGKMMMCKPSAHLVEYIENQNIDVQDIIRDLPDEMPITEFSGDIVNDQEVNTNVENNVTEGTDTPLVNSQINSATEDTVIPQVNSEVQTTPLIPTVDLSVPEVNVEEPQVVNGQAESIPIQGADGNVQLAATAVVQPLGVGIPQQTAPVAMNQQVVISNNPQVASATVPVATLPTLDKLGE